MYKAAVIGDIDPVTAFKALGLDVFTPTEKDEIRRTVDRVAAEDYGIIYITEQLAVQIPETISRYTTSMIPALILIPSNQGSMHIGLDRINEQVERAVGSNIL